jgi:hypothetical protein
MAREAVATVVTSVLCQERRQSLMLLVSLAAAAVAGEAKSVLALAVVAVTVLPFNPAITVLLS